MAQKKRKQNKAKSAQAERKEPPWLFILTFSLMGLLLFYPPFFRGLFFSHQMFIPHVITGAVFALVWARKIFLKEYSFIKTPLDWAVLAYAGAYLLSLLGAVHFGEAAYGFFKVLNYFMVFWIVSDLVKELNGFENVLRILLAAGVGVAAIGILAATGYSDIPGAFDGQHIMSTLQYHNTTAAYVGILSLIGISLWIREKQFLMKSIYGIAAYIMMLVTLSAISKGAWLVLIIGGLLLVIGMPAIYRVKTVYSLGLSLLAAFIISNRFVITITGDNPAAGLGLVVAGIVIILVGQVLWEGAVRLLLPRWKVSPAVVLALVICILAAGLVYTGNKVDVATVMGTEFAQITDRSDMSYVTRADFAKWGLAIVKDYPLVGAGAGGWNALYHQYQHYLFWTTETHNHFVQVWVEAGTIGLLAFLSMWVSFIFLVGQFIRKLQPFRKTSTGQNQETWVLIWGTTSAALALGAHAAIDFDLSLPAMCFLLWTFLALVNSQYRIHFKEKEERFNMAPVNVCLAAGLVLVLVVSGASSALAYNCSLKGAEAGVAINTAGDPAAKQKAYNEALYYYKKAAQLDAKNADYWRDMAYLQAAGLLTIGDSNRAGAMKMRSQLNTMVEKAEKLKPYDIKTRNSLANTLAMAGDIDGALRNVKATIKANPNDIKAYINGKSLLLQFAERLVELKNYEGARKFAAEAIKIDEQLAGQLTRVDPEHKYWQGEKLAAGAEMQQLTAKAQYILGDYQKALTGLQPFAHNLLALEFADPYFENTRFENEEWKVSVVDDDEAQNGKCLQIEAKKDKVDFSSALTLAKEIPIKEGSSYNCTVRYKVLNSEDNPAGQYVHNTLAVWSHWHTGEESLPRDLVFWTGKDQTSSPGWQVYKTTDTAPSGVTHRHFYLGTGSVKAGTVFRIDYITFTPVDWKVVEGTSLEELRTWYAAALNKLGKMDEYQVVVQNLSAPARNRLTYLIESK
ncbi:O-antigen ligase family protein [Syntrophomonas erecta subsp. sporosyntropha]